jgi:hypothetical protein
MIITESRPFRKGHNANQASLLPDATVSSLAGGTGYLKWIVAVGLIVSLRMKTIGPTQPT